MMKKFLILLVMTVLTVNLSAQVVVELDGDNEVGTDFGTNIDSSNRIYLGLKAGGNFASMNGLPSEFGLKEKSGIGFQGGLVAGIRFGRWTSKTAGGTGRFGIQLEAMYSQRTIKTDIEDLKLNYFEVPVLAQYYVTRDICIELGPTIAGTLSTSPDEIKSGNMTIATGDIKGFDVMLTGGVSYKHKSGLMVGARYNYGMSELAENFTGKVSTIAVSVGWTFNLNK